MSGIDTGLWGGMLSAMSVVVGFQLFFIQNWLSGCSALQNEAEPLKGESPRDPDRKEMAKKMRAHKASYPKLTTVVMTLTVVLFCVLSVVVGVQLEGVSVVFSASPGIVLLFAFLVVTGASWLRGTRRLDEIINWFDPDQPASQ